MVYGQSGRRGWRLLRRCRSEREKRGHVTMLLSPPYAHLRASSVVAPTTSLPLVPATTPWHCFRLTHCVQRIFIRTPTRFVHIVYSTPANRTSTLPPYRLVYEAYTALLAVGHTSFTRARSTRRIRHVLWATRLLAPDCLDGVLPTSACARIGPLLFLE